MKDTTRTREEFIELCRTNPEQAAELLLSLQEAIELQNERIQKLAEQLQSRRD